MKNETNETNARSNRAAFRPGHTLARVAPRARRVFDRATGEMGPVGTAEDGRRATAHAAEALRRATERIANALTMETGGGGARDERVDDGNGEWTTGGVAETTAMIDAHHALSAAVERSRGKEVAAYVEAVEEACASASDGRRAAAYEALEHVVGACSTRAFVRAHGKWTMMCAETVKAGGGGDDTSADGDASSSTTRAAAKALSAALQRSGGLLEVPGVRKEASTSVSTAAKGMMKLMRRGLIEGFELATTCAKMHSSALRPHAEALESACVDAVRGRSGGEVRSAAISCLASLPRITGDSGAWSEHWRRVAYSAHAAMNDAFDGAEDGELKRQLEVTLAPQNEGAPKSYYNSNNWPSGSVVAIESLLECLEEMLRLRYNCAIPIPCAATTTLVSRVLAVDGTAISSVPGLTAAPVESRIVLALPRLHTAALNVLDALLVAAQTRAVPQGGRIARALEGVLRRGTPTASVVENGEPIRQCMHVRAQAHNVVASAAYALGSAYVGAELSSAVATYVIQDAKPCGVGRSALASGAEKSKASGKKRKKGGAWGQATADGLDDLNTLAIIDDMSGAVAGDAALDAIELQTAALGALTAVCASGGAMIAPGIRSKIDATIAQAIGQVCDLSMPIEKLDDVSEKRRRAAFDALLASVLAPRPFRSPNLPLAVAVFSKAAQSPATCKHATFASLAINALLHPSAPPLAPQAIAPPIERMDPVGGSSAPQWSTFASHPDPGAHATTAADALRSSMGDYYKIAEAPVSVEPEPVRERTPEPEAPPAEDVDMDEPAHAPPVPQPKGPKTAPFTAPIITTAVGGFSAAAKAPTFAKSVATEPPSDFISFSAEPTATTSTKSADMWDTNPEPIGLGSGKSKVTMELSDDSDGELPEIHSESEDEEDEDEEASE
jgi:hypothetical protein